MSISLAVVPTNSSRKLTGLLLVLGTILGITIVAVIGIAIWGAPWELFASAYTAITTIGSVHQGAQAAADRSPNYSSNKSALDSISKYGGSSNG